MNADLYRVFMSKIS
jgi:hypothetical protein